MPVIWTRRLPLRLRLTLWVTAISAVIKASVGVVFYFYQYEAVSRFFNTHIDRRTAHMIERLAPLVPNVTTQTLEAISEDESSGAMFSGFILSVYDAEGQLLATMRKRNPPVEFPDAPNLSAIAKSGEIVHRRRPADEVKRFDPQATKARGVLRGFVGADNQRYLLTAATSDSYAEQMTGLVARALLVVIPTGVGVTALCGWLVAGLAVRPLNIVKESASRLTPEHIGERIRLREQPGGASPEQLQLEEALESARKRLAAAFAAQERFMSNVSHELKTPISVMMTEAQTLNMQGCSADTAAFVRSSIQELRRLGTMVDSFLLLTRVREGRAPVRDQRYPLNELLMDSMEHCLPMAEQYGVALKPRLSEAEPAPEVHGDPSLLQTMIDNLIRNAIRFSPRGKSIDLSIEAGSATNKVLVRDHGAGIPEEIIGRIFDRFVQAPEETRRGRGHGLGLEIAQGIAELHGGSISVRNCAPEDGGGCEFEVCLPAAAPNGQSNGSRWGGNETPCKPMAGGKAPAGRE